MQLVGCLCSGVRGAELGFARLYAFGTSTRVVYYSDFSGTVHTTSGNDLILDSNGGGIVYVNQLTDILVYDSSGNLIRSFTEGEAAPNTEVISQSFTGVNRTTGVSATSQPTTLQALLDLWETQNGAPDWQVLFGGSPATIQAAVAGIAGLYYNVKAPTYGAAGDGATDDTTPIQNAINAAAVSSGTVVFPAGTYRTTAALTLPINVNMLGLGTVRILVDSSTANTLTFSASSGIAVNYNKIENIAFSASQTNSGHSLQVNASTVYYTIFLNCGFGGSFLTADSVLFSDNLAHDIVFDSCRFDAIGATSPALTCDQASPRVRVRGSRLLIGQGGYTATAVTGRRMSLLGCTFDLSQASSGTMTAVVLNSTPTATIVGCEFIAPSAGTSTCMSLTNANASGTSVTEAGNILRGTWTSIYSGFTAGSNIPSQQALTRDSRGFNTTDNAATVDVKADQYGYTSLTRTNTANQTLTSSVGYGGATWTLIFFNNGGGASGVITFGTGFDVNTPTITGLANGKIATYQFRAVYVNGAAAWVPVSAQLGNL